MKFWHKAYLFILVLFLIAFDTGAYLLVQKSYQINQNANTQVGMNEFSSVSDMLKFTLAAYQKSTSGGIRPLITSFANGYMQKGMYMEVYEGKNLLYSNFIKFNDNRTELNSQDIITVYRNDKQSPLPFYSWKTT